MTNKKSKIVEVTTIFWLFFFRLVSYRDVEMLVIAHENRAKNKQNKQNPTNDVSFRISPPIERVAALSLVSAHIPNSQLLIEETNNRLFFCDGFLPDARRNRFIVADINHEYIVNVPPIVNPIVSVTQLGNRTQCMFQYMHGLPHKYATFQNNSNRPLEDVTIIDRFTIELQQRDDKLPVRYGYIFSPSFANPREFADYIDLHINREFSLFNDNTYESVFRFKWSEIMSRFVFQITPYGEAFVLDLQIVCDETTLDLGFASGARNGISASKIVAQNECAAVQSITLTPNNYDIGSLLSEIEFQFNRFVICERNNMLVFNDNVRIYVAHGLFTQRTFVNAIQTELYRVGLDIHFHILDDACVFESGRACVLHFDQSDVHFVRTLGFEPIVYTGCKEYIGEKRAPMHAAQSVFQCAAYLHHDKQICLQFFRPVCLFVAVPNIDPGDKGLWQLHSDCMPALQKGDIIQRKGMLDIFVVYDFSYVNGCRVMPLFLFAELGKSEVSFEILSLPTVSILLNKLGKHAVRPSLFGWGVRDLLCERMRCTIMSPFVYNLDPFPYVLVQLIDNDCDSNVQHGVRDGHKLTILGQVQTSSHMSTHSKRHKADVLGTVSFRMSTTLSTLHIRILNPDYSLYQLHAQDFILVLQTAK
jgi:hypothetical protein